MSMAGANPDARRIPLTIIGSSKPVMQEAHDHQQDAKG
jgi:hypothetical protein